MLAYLQGLKFGVRLWVLRTVPQMPRSGRAMCAALALPRMRSAAVTWITHCCLLNMLTFDEFERVMRAVKNAVFWKH